MLFLAIGCKDDRDRQTTTPASPETVATGEQRTDDRDDTAAIPAGTAEEDSPVDRTGITPSTGAGGTYSEMGTTGGSRAPGTAGTYDSASPPSSATAPTGTAETGTTTGTGTTAGTGTGTTTDTAPATGTATIDPGASPTGTSAGTTGSPSTPPANTTASNTGTGTAANTGTGTSGTTGTNMAGTTGTGTGTTANTGTGTSGATASTTGTANTGNRPADTARDRVDTRTTARATNTAQATNGDLAVLAACPDRAATVAELQALNPDGREVAVGKAAVLVEGQGTQRLTAVDDDSPCQVTVAAPSGVDAVALGRAILDTLPPRG